MPPIIPIPHEVPNENGEGGSSNEPAENFVSDSDTLSEEEEHHNGYEPLSQDPENCNENPNDLVEDCNHSTEDNSMDFEISWGNPVLVMLPPYEEVITDPSNSQKESLKLDEDKVETIKTVMKSITLPVSNLPQWASNVPEEEWKAALMTQMLNKSCNISFPVREANTKSDTLNEASR